MKSPKTEALSQVLVELRTDMESRLTALQEAVANAVSGLEEKVQFGIDPALQDEDFAMLESHVSHFEQALIRMNRNTKSLTDDLCEAAWKKIEQSIVELKRIKAGGP